MGYPPVGSQYHNTGAVMNAPQQHYGMPFYPSAYPPAHYPQFTPGTGPGQLQPWDHYPMGHPPAPALQPVPMHPYNNPPVNETVGSARAHDDRRGEVGERAHTATEVPQRVRTRPNKLLGEHQGKPSKWYYSLGQEA
jgi:hypothetical protein